MSGFAEINQEMSDLAKDIELLSGGLEDSRTAYEQAKHALEMTYSGFIITGKAENPEWTQTDLTAYAIRQSSDVKAKMILAHGEYRRLRAELNAKRERMDTVKERGWNLRQELKRLSAEQF